VFYPEEYMKRFGRGLWERRKSVLRKEYPLKVIAPCDRYNIVSGYNIYYLFCF